MVQGNNILYTNCCTWLPRTATQLLREVRKMQFHYVPRPGADSMDTYSSKVRSTPHLTATTFYASSNSKQVTITRKGAPMRGGGAAGLQPPPPNHQKLKINKHRFCTYYGIKSFTRFPFSRNHPLKLFGD
jgi:hypothetical protein